MQSCAQPLISRACVTKTLAVEVNFHRLGKCYVCWSLTCMHKLFCYRLYYIYYWCNGIHFVYLHLFILYIHICYIWLNKIIKHEQKFWIVVFVFSFTKYNELTHWGRVTQVCISKLATIGSDDHLSPGGCQAITWTNAGTLLIAPLGTNFSEILIKIYAFLFKKMHLKMSSGKWRPFCLGLNVLIKTDSCRHLSREIVVSLPDHQT